MVRTPQPDIVNYNVTTIDNHATRSLSSWCRTADATRYVENSRRIGAVIHVTDIDIPDLQDIIATGIEQQTSDNEAIYVRDDNGWCVLRGVESCQNRGRGPPCWGFVPQ